MPEPADMPFDPPQLRRIPVTAPVRWLGRGFSDMLAAPVPSLFYGGLLATMGWALVTHYGGAIGLALTTGFLLIGPFLAVGIYDISRQIAAGARVDFPRTLTAWRANRPAIGFYALILMLSLAVWMRISVVLVALLVPGGFESLADFLSLMSRAPGMWVFLLIYLAIGAILATFSFAISAVALPMLLDRTEMDAISAMIASFRAIAENPRPMLLWAALIVFLIGAGFTTWFVGLALTVPLVGHATWHAYGEVVLPLASERPHAADAAPVQNA